MGSTYTLRKIMRAITKPLIAYRRSDSGIEVPAERLPPHIRGVRIEDMPPHQRPVVMTASNARNVRAKDPRLAVIDRTMCQINRTVRQIAKYATIVK